jgi:uncharacterized membrane protein
MLSFVGSAVNLLEAPTMHRILKVAHIIGLAVFLGSIPGHIVLGALGDPVADPTGFALLMHAKHVNVVVLTIPALVFTALTGAALAWRRRLSPAAHRWLGVKVVLVGLIGVNGALVLRPLSAEIARMAAEAAAGGIVPAAIASLAARESAFGAANLAMVVAVIALSVARPRLGAMQGPASSRPGVV